MNFYSLLIIALFATTSNNLMAQLPGCASSVAAFPYNEGFESGYGVWTDDATEQFNWTRDSGGTTSGSTGPTTGSAASTWYMYIETSSPRVNGDQAWLESDCFDFTALTNPVMEFDYHMYGASTGSLDLRISTDGVVWTSIWTLAGNQGNSWQTASVNLTAYAGLTVGFQFRGTRGTSYTGDIAIDELTIFNEVPMTYQSSTTFQASTANVGNCETSAQIIGMEVATLGTLTPISATQFTIGTAGTTSLADVSAINIYYTGSSSVYSTGTLFGTAAPGGTVAVNGSQALVAGTNYFWVEYILIPIMTNGNNLDATCSGLVVSGTGYAPTITSPVGQRSIGACNPSAGGISGDLQVWFDANVGTSGTPVVTWANQGPNVNVPSVTSSLGSPLLQNYARANYNNIIDLQGNVSIHNGTFHHEVAQRTDVISGNGVTMYCAYQSTGAPDLIFEFHSSTVGGGADPINQWRTWGFRHAGIGTLFSSGTGTAYDAATLAQASSNSNFVGLNGTEGGSGGSITNGTDVSVVSTGTWYSGTSDMELSIGYWPGYGTGRDVMETILWDRNLGATERDRVETYLALKYGITLGINGTSMNYLSPSTGIVVWDVAANAGFNYDIAGIARADASGLDQRKSHSTNGSAIDSYNDIVTIANGTNFASPSLLSQDRSFLIWGHDNGPLLNTGVMVNYPTDNGETIEAIFQREWKSQESGTVNSVTIEFDLSSVVGVGGILGSNDLQYLRLLVDEDGDYSDGGATSIAPSAYNNVTNIAYFTVDFLAPSGPETTPLRGYFFTLASTNSQLNPLPVELASYEVTSDECSNKIEWTTASELNSDSFIIQRSYDMSDWEQVGVVAGAGSSNSMLDYLYRDNDYAQNGLVYYRILQVDTDGATTEIGLQVVNAYCAENVEPIAYPNPVTNELSIKSAISGTAIITDLNGRIITEIELSEGVTSIEMAHLQQGSYLLQLRLSNGKSYIDQFIKL